MKKFLPLALAAGALIAVPASAHPGKSHSNKSHTNTHSGHCKHSTLTRSYVFSGTLTGNPTLTQTAGQNTATNSDDLFTAGLTFTVTSANKYAKADHPKGSTFTDSLANVAVNLGQNADNTQRTPQGGDHVTIHARRAFKTKRNCTANAAAPVGGVHFKSVAFGGQPATTP